MKASPTTHVTALHLRPEPGLPRYQDFEVRATEGKYVLAIGTGYEAFRIFSPDLDTLATFLADLQRGVEDAIFAEQVAERHERQGNEGLPMPGHEVTFSGGEDDESAEVVDVQRNMDGWVIDAHIDGNRLTRRVTSMRRTSPDHAPIQHWIAELAF